MAEDKRELDIVFMAYTYYMNKSGSNYQILDSSLNVIYEYPSSRFAFDWLLTQLNSGDTVDVLAGAYYVDGTWVITPAVTNVTITFESGAILTAKNELNSPVFYIQSTSGITIIGGIFDGNRAGQTQNWSANGIQLINCTDCLINGVTITNVRQFGLGIGGTSINCGIINSSISYCAWNGMTLGDEAGVPMNLYALNNDVSHCADVGITSYAIDTTISDNKVHDMENIGLNDHVGSGAMWGIACEGGSGSGNGKYIIIDRNTITNSASGIVISTSGKTAINYVSISNNEITNAVSSVYSAIHLDNSSFSVIKNNIVTNANIGVSINSLCVNVNIYPNTFVNCATLIMDNGTDTIYTNPIPLPFHDAFTDPALTNWNKINGNWNAQ